jgi:hypothetical protein
VSYKGVSKSFRTGRLELEPQMVQLSATRFSCIAILWVSIVSFPAINLCVASQRVFIVVVIYLANQSGNFWIHPRMLHNVMEQSPHSKAGSGSAGQEILHFWWNRNVHYCVHNRLPLDTSQSQLNPFYVITPYTAVRSISVLPPHLQLHLPSDHYLQVFRLKLFMNSSFLAFVLHVPPISFSFIWSLWWLGIMTFLLM